MKKNLILGMLMIGMMLTSSQNLRAASINALEFTGGGTTTNTTFLNLGWRFSVVNDITVSALGMYVPNNNSVSDDIIVTLYDTSASVLARTTIEPGDGGFLDGSFRYNTITPLQLTAGQTYAISGYWNASNPSAYAFRATATTIPEIRFDTALGTNVFIGPVLPPVYFENIDDGFFGPNFQVSDSAAAAVPEPGTMLLFSLGLVTLAGLSRRQRRF